MQHKFPPADRRGGFHPILYTLFPCLIVLLIAIFWHTSTNTNDLQPTPNILKVVPKPNHELEEICKIHARLLSVYPNRDVETFLEFLEIDIYGPAFKNPSASWTDQDGHLSDKAQEMVWKSHSKKLSRLLLDKEERVYEGEEVLNRIGVLFRLMKVLITPNYAAAYEREVVRKVRGKSKKDKLRELGQICAVY